MTLPAADIRTIRGEIGSASPPTDADLTAWLAELGSTTAVALYVLRPRLADAIAAGQRPSFTLSGVFSVGAPADPKYLARQIARLEGDLAAEDAGLAMATTGFLRRDDVTR